MGNFAPTPPMKVAEESSHVGETAIAEELLPTDEELDAFLTDWFRPPPISSSAEIDVLGATEASGETNLLFSRVDLTDCLGDCLPAIVDVVEETWVATADVATSSTERSSTACQAPLVTRNAATISNRASTSDVSTSTYPPARRGMGTQTSLLLADGFVANPPPGGLSFIQLVDEVRMHTHWTIPRSCNVLGLATDVPFSAPGTGARTNAHDDNSYFSVRGAIRGRLSAAGRSRFAC